MHTEMRVRTRGVTRAVVSEVFGEFFTAPEALDRIVRQVVPDILDELDRTRSVVIEQRMVRAAGAGVAPLLQALTSCSTPPPTLDLGKMSSFRSILAHRLEALLSELRCAFMGLSLHEISSSSTQALFDIPSMGAAYADRVRVRAARARDPDGRWRQPPQDRVRDACAGPGGHDRLGGGGPGQGRGYDVWGQGCYDRGGDPGWEDREGRGEDVSGRGYVG